MKKLLFLAIMLLPPPIVAMQDQNEKEYYEHAMGSLVLVKETPKENGGSHIEGEFRKGDKVTCIKDSNGNVEAKFVLKKGGEIGPEAMLDTAENLYDSLKRKALKKAGEQTAIKQN